MTPRCPEGLADIGGRILSAVTSHITTGDSDQPLEDPLLDELDDEHDEAKVNEAGETSRKLDRSTAGRVLRLAELIVGRSEYGVWPRSTYPTVEQMTTQLDATPADVGAAVELLMWRRLLFTQHDPDLGHRLLPAPDLATRKAAVQVADRIALRIKLGLWTGADFPTIEAITGEFGSSLATVTGAMKILSSEELVHKVVIDSGVKGPGSRRQMWRPTGVADQSVRDLAPALRQAIADGELGPVLPTKSEAAERYRVTGGLVADAYHRLQQEGLIQVGWLPRGRRPIWYVVSDGGPPEGVLPGEVRCIAVAARMIKDLPEWLLAHRNGSWFRRPLPPQRELIARYRVHGFDIERGAELLVRLQILERAPVGHRLYLPRPPADRETAAHDVTFRVVGKPPPRPWVAARDTAAWQPLPTSADDENVRLVDSLEPRLARKKPKPRPEGRA